MNWKLIFQLSLLGLAMSLGTVYFIPSSVEPFCWIAAFIISAYFIAAKCSGKYFLNGFVLSLVNCVWIVLFHILLYKTYAANHVPEMAMMEKMPMSTHPRLMMLVSGIIIGIVCGLVQGLLAFLASKMVKKPAAM